MRYEQFDKPTQVVFWDHDGDHWCSGIAYGGIIICGCCGGIVEIEEIYEFAPEHIYKPIWPYDNWVDISNAISGDAMPEGMDEEVYE